VTNLRWLNWVITRHYRSQGLEVRLRSIRLGNTAIDGEVIGDGWRMAVEIKTPNDDVTRGLGQLAEALAYGYDKAALITTLQHARRIKTKVFRKLGLTLIEIDSKGILHQLYPVKYSLQRKLTRQPTRHPLLLPLLHLFKCLRFHNLPLHNQLTIRHHCLLLQS